MGNPTLQSQDRKDVWQTPDWLWKGIAEAENGIDIDPCAGPNTQIADVNLSIVNGHDGLKGPFLGNAVVFVNPPYSQKEVWIQKVIDEFHRGNPPKVVYVVHPDSTDAAWFNGKGTPRGWPPDSVPSYVDNPDEWWDGGVVPNATAIWFSNKRVKFIDPETGEQAGSPAHNTCISIYGDPSTDALRFLGKHGWFANVGIL